MLRKFLVVLGVVAGAAASPASAYVAINLTSPGLEYSGAPYTLGFQFSVASNTSIISLGAYDSGQDGLVQAAQVGLWDLSGNLLTSAVVSSGTSGTLIG